MGAAAPAPAVLHLSLVVGGALHDRGGERLGKVDDLLVRLGEDYPPVTGVLATVAGRQVFVPAAQVAKIAHGRVTLQAVKIDLQRFERLYGEVLLRKDVLGVQVVNGALLPILLVFIWRLASNRELMGDYRNGRVFNAVAVLTVLATSGLSIALLVVTLLGPLL